MLPDLGRHVYLWMSINFKQVWNPGMNEIECLNLTSMASDGFYLQFAYDAWWLMALNCAILLYCAFAFFAHAHAHKCKCNNMQSITCLLTLWSVNCDFSAACCVLLSDQTRVLAEKFEFELWVPSNLFEFKRLRKKCSLRYPTVFML